MLWLGNVTLRRYWFEFRNAQGRETSLGVGRGCGVTALDHADALTILEQLVFEGEPLPAIERVIEDVDVSTLDPGHVLPNMGLVCARGVWFPGGYGPARDPGRR